MVGWSSSWGLLVLLLPLPLLLLLLLLLLAVESGVVIDEDIGG
jgi:hypothetical protein